VLQLGREFSDRSRGRILLQGFASNADSISESGAARLHPGTAEAIESDPVHEPKTAWD
jgi:hypothetical protein